MKYSVMRVTAAAPAIPNTGIKKIFSMIFIRSPKKVTFIFCLNIPMPLRTTPVRLLSASPVTDRESIFRMKIDSANLSV